ncbi:Pentatricopeptide repeat-containing protein [Arachis hypogaea]|nr:Pentatricopeptide repeat-containing protein [Arachis hypogaea]
MLRYTLLQILNSVPHSALDFCFTSTSSLHSHSQPQSLDEAIDSFTRMLFMCRPPSILQFLKILGSLAKTNHCPTAISLFQQLQSRIFKSDFQPYTVTLTTIKDAKKMEKKIEIVEYRERLDNTLASPHMTNYHMLKNLVQTQLLHSSKQLEFYQGEGADSLR